MSNNRHEFRTLDPLVVETAFTILRIDEYIIGRKPSEPEYYYVNESYIPQKAQKMRRDYGLQTLE